MRARYLLLLAAAIAFAEDKPPADPITDRLRFEVALAQRDYLAAKAQLDQAAAQLRAKTQQAEQACAAAHLSYNAETFACTTTARPVPPGDAK